MDVQTASRVDGCACHVNYIANALQILKRWLACPWLLKVHCQWWQYNFTVNIRRAVWFAISALDASVI
jgi:hypothetical protein